MGKQELSNWNIDGDGLNQVTSTGHKLHIFGMAYSKKFNEIFPLAMEVSILYKIGFWKKKNR